MTKLRMSLADKCNFRCIYCMPEDACFVPDEKLLNRNEIFEICENLVSFGIREIRLTGGEPTLRTDFLEIAKDLSRLDLDSLSVTTNGFHIGKMLHELKDTKCKNINYSLDSLCADNFKKMTRSNSFKRVYDNIILSKELGFKVKVNVVVMKGYNEHEIDDFIEFSARTGIEVRFLESMKIGVMKEKYDDFFISADEMIESISNKWKISKLDRAWSATSFNYGLENGANIGFIASETKPFCNECSRLRISATGIFRPCLMIEHGTDIRGLSRDELYSLVTNKMEDKPIDRIEQTSSSMYQLGG